jgi:hypothetical protein
MIQNHANTSSVINLKCSTKRLSVLQVDEVDENDNDGFQLKSPSHSLQQIQSILFQPQN